MIADNQSV
jgi:hypothetical protein